MIHSKFVQFRAHLLLVSFLAVTLFWLGIVTTVEANHCPQNPTDPICVCEDSGGAWNLTNGTCSNAGGGGGNPGGGGQNPGPTISLLNPLQSTSITDFLIKIIDILLVFALPIIILFIMYSGFLFVTARGNESQITTAKSAFTWAVIGGVIILGAKLIITVIQGTVSAL